MTRVIRNCQSKKARKYNDKNNQNLSSPLPTPPPSSESGSGSSGEMTSKGMFPCKYCDMLFPNYRALKGIVK
jgi:hypothetical protein